MHINVLYLSLYCSNGVYYKVDMYPADEYGKRKLMNKHEIRDRISQIWEESKGMCSLTLLWINILHINLFSVCKLFSVSNSLSSGQMSYIYHSRIELHLIWFVYDYLHTCMCMYTCTHTHTHTHMQLRYRSMSQLLVIYWFAVLLV